MRFGIPALLIITLLSGGCATTKTHEPVTSIGPFNTFTGRLIVIEPTRRWQVIVDWNGVPDKGVVRLTHAASNRIVQVAWDHENMQIRDNADRSHQWKSVSKQTLSENGIILPPQQLARILSDDMPGDLIEKRPGEWEGRIDASFLRIKWSEKQQRLELTDMTHGRTAILIIQP
ncbi:MAG TPA: lipoprotein insertase outer membrane protein LolB [Mariprofundaceae bacterium]|nr:lipoprotein insertase outer membrane protein LolB [Mariprofundaceae bacterium]